MISIEQSAEQEKQQDTVAKAAPEPARPKSKDVILGDQVVVIKRLGTRDGLAVAQKLLGYVSALREPLLAAYSRFENAQQRDEGEGAHDRTGEYLEIGMEMVKAVMAVLGDDDLLRVLSRLLGQPVEVVGDAPIEDTMNALADAFSINDMPRLLEAASRIWTEASKMSQRL